MILRVHIISILFVLVNVSLVGQSSEIDILNDVISDLVGEHKNKNIPVFTSLERACQSSYVECNRRKSKITGLDFQFANLNGQIPENISKLKDLKHINLDFNYLSGSIPKTLTDLKKLKELRLNGNFLTGPVAPELLNLGKSAMVDLSRNSIKTQNKKLIDVLRIHNQINLEGCRSPDSIFINEKMKFDSLTAVTPKLEIDENIEVKEEMPRFPGCEKEELSMEEREECAKNTMLQFIYRTLKYPHIARVNGVEGMIVVQFVILSTGEIGYANVVRDIGGRCGNAGLWVVNRMNYICDRWTPGVQMGKKVKVLYTLPIKFQLQR